MYTGSCDQTVEPRHGRPGWGSSLRTRTCLKAFSRIVGGEDLRPVSARVGNVKNNDRVASLGAAICQHSPDAVLVVKWDHLLPMAAISAVQPTR